MFEEIQSKEEQLSEIWNSMVSTYTEKDNLMKKLEITSSLNKYDLLNEVEKLQTQFYNLENQYYDLKNCI